MVKNALFYKFALVVMNITYTILGGGVGGRDGKERPCPPST
jgi:hypothetical protein